MMRSQISFIAAVVLLLPGCYSTEHRYVPGKPLVTADAEPITSPGEPTMESGEPYWFLDYPGHFLFSLPTKLVLLNWKAANHQISEETREIMRDYLDRNGLTDVKVRFNQYAPLDEFRRMWRNPRVHPAAKYTVGLVSWLIYTLVPDRLFAGLLGGDAYNPYSNTIYIYSDLPSVVVHEAGHAKDFSMRHRPTGYAMLRAIPIVGPLYQEARASDDAIRYFRGSCDESGERRAYKELFPAFSTYMLGDLGSGLLGPAISVPGHIWGDLKGRQFSRERRPPCTPLASRPAQALRPSWKAPTAR